MTRPQFIFPISIAIVFFLSASCSIEPGITEPIDYLGAAANTNPVSSNVKPFIEGIYRVTEGQSDFGDFAAVKFTKNHLSLFCGKNSSYFILSSGERDSSLFFEGFWRFSQSYSTGKASLFIDKDEGGADILSNTFSRGSAAIIKGFYYGENSGAGSPVRMEYMKPAQNDSAFFCIAHRGGGRNSDRLQASENSLEILLMAEYFGATAVEIDVQITKDNRAILFHDEEFTPRLVKGNYLIGAVSSFSFKQIRTFGALINGEKIPTLEEALDAIVTKTSLKLVWLDIKTPGAIAVIAPIQKKYSDLAVSLNRNVAVLLGLPSDDILNTYAVYPGKENHPALCELSITSVRKADAKVWAPRWTDGIQKQLITGAQAEGRKVFVWTLDIPEFIRDFLATGYYDGILTNYPSVVAYEYYMNWNE